MKCKYTVKCFRANEDGDLELWLERFFESYYSVSVFVHHHLECEGYDSIQIYKIVSI